MSKIFEKLLYKILILVIVFSLIISFREKLITNSALKKLFETILGELPFIDLISDAVISVLGFNYKPPEFTVDKYFSDMIKLAVMTLLQPLTTSLLISMFLPMPPRNQILQTSLLPMSEVYEDYTSTPGYMIKALIIQIISTVPLALLAGWLIGIIQVALSSALGGLGSGIVQTLILLVILILSVIRLSGIIGGVAAAFIWRGGGFLIEMLKMIVTEFLCVLAYYAFISQKYGGLIPIIFAFVIWLVLMEQALKIFHEAVVR